MEAANLTEPMKQKMMDFLQQKESRCFLRLSGGDLALDGYAAGPTPLRKTGPAKAVLLGFYRGTAPANLGYSLQLIYRILHRTR